MISLIYKILLFLHYKFGLNLRLILANFREFGKFKIRVLQTYPLKMNLTLEIQKGCQKDRETLLLDHPPFPKLLLLLNNASTGLCTFDLFVLGISF
jgi:hypothetical protein